MRSIFDKEMTGQNIFLLRTVPIHDMPFFAHASLILGMITPRMRFSLVMDSISSVSEGTFDIGGNTVLLLPPESPGGRLFPAHIAAATPEWLKDLVHT